MRKIILFASLCLTSMSSFAQLRVNQYGRVSIGEIESNSSMLSVGCNGISGYAATFQGNSGGIAIKNEAKGGTRRYGMRISNGLSVDTTTIGIYIWADGTTNKPCYGIQSISGESSYGSYGVVGGLRPKEIGRGAGIFGSSTNLLTIPQDDSNIYAGYFKGDVRVTGGLYGTLLTPSESSTSSVALVNDVTEQSDGYSNRIIDKLQHVQLLQFRRPSQIEITNTLNGNLSVTEIESSSENIPLDNPISIQTELSPVKYGLAADQLRNIYPELVYEDNDGKLSINYIEMIPLLVQSINELNAKIAELEGSGNGNVELMARDRGNATGIDAMNDTEVLSLAQNKPNPFSEKTTIEVTIPENTTNAVLFIYDMNGKQVKQINITERGKTNVSITSEGLEPGMFLYSLIADGKIVNTKKMILTK